MGSERNDDDNSNPNTDNSKRGYIVLIMYRVLFQVLCKCSQPLQQLDESRYYPLHQFSDGHFFTF